MPFLKKFPWIFPTLIFTVLILPGALAHPLWGDEATIANYAVNVTKFGLPYGWDGVNLVGGWSGVLINSDLLNSINSWTEIYLQALSFAIFGKSSFGARLPFVTLSILSIPLFFYTCQKITKNKQISLLATLILSSMVPFILYASNARYFAIIVFGSLLMVNGSLDLENNRRSKLKFLTGNVLYIYSLYLIFPWFYLSLFSANMIYRIYQKQNLSTLKKFAINYIGLGLLTVLAFLPWFIFVKPSTYFTGFSWINLFEFLVSVGFWAKQVFDPFNLGSVFPYILIIPTVILLKYGNKQAKSALIFSTSLIIIYILTISVLSSITESSAYIIPSVNRYHVILFPLFALTAAIIFWQIAQFSKVIFVIILAIYLFTNVFSFNKPRSFLLEYVKEISNPYPTATEAVADFLKANAKDGDLAFISADRNHDPLIFQLGEKVRFVNQIQPGDPKFFPKNYSKLPHYIYGYIGKPDWVILYSKRGKDGTADTADFRLQFPLGLHPSVNLEKDYVQTALSVFFVDSSRPEITEHRFGAIKPNYTDQVFIYKKM